MRLLLIALGATWLFYLLFLVYAAVDEARDAGRAIPRLAKLLIYPAIAFGYLLDVAWNCTLGSLLFLEPPFAGGGHPLKWTFTARLKRHRDRADWRGRQARWWASLLNPFDPGHV